MPLEPKASPVNLVQVGTEYPNDFPKDADQQQPWWVDVRKVLLRRDEQLQKVYDSSDRSGSSDEAIAAMQASIASLSGTVRALSEKTTQLQDNINFILSRIVDLQNATTTTTVTTLAPDDGSPKLSVSEKYALVGTSGAPSKDNKFVTNADARLLFVGVIMPYGGTSVPTGWLACDGSAVSRTTYDALFAIVGTSFGSGNGTTTFNLPDLQGRAPIGSGSGSGLTARTLGAKGGEEEHQLTIDELPASIDAWNHTEPATPDLGSAIKLLADNDLGEGAITAPLGSGDKHNNMQPFTVVKFIIKF